MRKILHVATGAVLAALLTVGIARGADWPNYRGPNYDGVTAESIDYWPPVELWRANIGQGYSCVAVADGSVYCSGWNPSQDTVSRFSEYHSGGGTQSSLNSYSYGCPSVSYQGTRATPTVDKANGLVYMFSHQGILTCLSSTDLSYQWSIDLGTGGRPGWGYGSSVLIEGDLAIVNKDSAGTAVNTTTHAIAWGGGDSSAGYATPFAFTDGSQRTVVTYGGGNVSGVDPANGNVLWWFGWNQGMADPIILPGDRVWASAGYGKGCTVRLLGSGELTNNSASEWENTNLRNKENCSVYYGGYVYGSDESARIKKIDPANGSQTWQSPDAYGTESAVMMAGGELVVMTGNDGGANGRISVLSLADGSRSHTQDDIMGQGGSQTWSTPTVANANMYLRAQNGVMVCYAIADPTLTVATIPSGRTVNVDAGDRTGPYSVTTTRGGTHTVLEPAQQTVGSTRYTFSSWTDIANAYDEPSDTLTVPIASCTLTANFTTEHQLTVAANLPAGGDVNQTDGSWHVEGTVLTVSTTVNTGYVFDNWSGDLSGRNATGNSLMMSTPRSITANFQADTDNDGMGDTWEGTYGLDVGTDDSGGNPDADSFTNLQEWLNGTSPQFNDDPQFLLNVTIDPVAGGSVSPVDGSSHSEYTTISMVATANPSYVFDYWSGNLSSRAATVNLYMSADRSVTAHFQADTDNDGMGDTWETANGLLVGTDDSGDDPDADGSTNLQEYQAGSDPNADNAGGGQSGLSCAAGGAAGTLAFALVLAALLLAYRPKVALD